MIPFVVVIPARYGASRLPGKPLLPIAGKPMIAHVVENAQKSAALRVIVATDDARIADAAKGAGAQVVMTGSDHVSGSDRIAEVAKALQFDDDMIIVNVQGDEPQMPQVLINQVAQLLAQKTAANMATLATPITSGQEFLDGAVVKVVCSQDDYALYFSRAPIPYARQQNNSQLMEQAYENGMRHLGIYAYRCAFIKAFAQLSPAPLENIEKLEQLRALWHGEKIACAKAQALPGIGVDTEEDLQRLRQQMENGAS